MNRAISARMSYGRQAFAVAGPTAWNSLSDDLRDLTLSTDSFRRLLNTRLFSEYYYTQRIRAFTGIALYALYKFTTNLLSDLHAIAKCPSISDDAVLCQNGIDENSCVYKCKHLVN